MGWIIWFSSEGLRIHLTAEYLASSFLFHHLVLFHASIHVFFFFTLFKSRGSELYSNWFPVVLGVAEPLSECSAEARDDEAFKLCPTAGSMWGPSHGHGQTSVLPRLWLLLQSRESLALPKRTFVGLWLGFSMTSQWPRNSWLSACVWKALEFLLQPHLSKTLKGISCGHRVGCLHGVSARSKHLPPVPSNLCLGAQRSELLSTLRRGGQQGERGHHCQGWYNIYCASHPRPLHAQHLRGQSGHHHWRVCASCLIYVPR